MIFLTGEWRMKLIGLILLTLTAVSSPKSSAHFGGISGGGGNVMYAGSVQRQMSADRVEQRIEELRPVVLQYLGEKKAQFDSGKLDQTSTATFAPLFANQQNIMGALERVRLSVREEHPCYTRDGASFDGTSEGKGGGRICMSAHSISTKVDYSEVDLQTSALMVHEFSEIAGANDEQAIAIQIAVLKDLNN